MTKCDYVFNNFPRWVKCIFVYSGPVHLAVSRNAL